ncbi:MAG: chloramphenicol acetyltransferase [Anaerolineales bacterium]|nr:chloramphenicol acetyltransferase [Anaerolineales bacterium]
MRPIDMQTWPRREHFKVFKNMGYPHFSLCANMEISAFQPYVKAQGISFTVAMMYLIAKTANAIPEFRYRIHGEQVVEHEVVHPSTTILTNTELFTFCSIPYNADFPAFAAKAAEVIAHVKEHPTLEDEPGQDNLLFMTAIPWVSFTSLMHPIDLNPADSVPRFAWGKFFTDAEKIKLPLSVQGHHAVMDGIHLGRFYQLIQADLDQPEIMLGNV